MHAVDFSPGTHIATAAKELVQAAAEHGSAEGSFNEIVLKAEPGTTSDQIVAYFNAECERRSEEYRQSPEGREAERRSNERRASLQAKHDALMRRLATLDFGDDVAVLDWLCEMQEPSDHVGVIVRKKTILEAFAKHGFEPGANCGENFRPESRENVHRYIVGQCLDGLQSIAIHGIVHKFARDWKVKFLASANPG